MTATIPTGMRVAPGPKVEASQVEFDWEYGHNWPILLVSELAEKWDVCERQIHELADAGRFLAFAVNHDDHPQREHLRIVRATANRDLRAIVAEDWLRTIATLDAWLFPHTRQIVSIKDTANALRCFPTHVRKLYECGQIRAVLIGTGSIREHLRIERASVVEFVRRRIRAKNGLPMPEVNGNKRG